MTARVRKPYDPNLKDVDIALTPTLIRALGAPGAVVAKQIKHWGQYHGGWFEASSADLADFTGMSPDTCRREVKKLVEGGYVEKQNTCNTHGVQKCKYRPTDQYYQLEAARKAVGGSAGPGPGDNAEPTYVSDETKNPPTPPCRGDQGQGSLLGDKPTAEPKPKRTRRAKADPTEYDPAFEQAWEIYPRGGRDARGESYGKRGDKAAAERAFLALVGRGVSSEEITRRVANFAAARTLAEERFGGPAPVTGAQRFFNEKHKLWNAPVVDASDERVENWEWACHQHRPDATPEAVDPFDLAWVAFDTNRGKDHVERAKAALADRPDIWAALQRVWPQMNNQFTNRKQFAAAYQATTRGSAA